MSRYRAPAPIVWRCPDCGGGVTSKYARKNHVCPQVRVAAGGVVARPAGPQGANS